MRNFELSKRGWVRLTFYTIMMALVVLVMTSSCTKTTQVLVEKPKMNIEIKEKNGPEFFTQKKLEGISSADSIKLFNKALFYNGCEIVIEKALGYHSFEVDDNGAVIKTDSINAKQKIVGKETPGGLIPNSITIYKNSRGIIRSMKISFSQNDANYEFTFFRKEDGRFELSGNSVITINGKPHNVIAKTNETCYLKFYFDYKQVINKTTEKAEGWKAGSTPNNNKTKTVENDGFTPSYTPVK